MPSSVDEGLLYINNPNKNIYILDHEVEVLKKLGNILVEEYPSFQILAFDNWEDLNDDLISEMPTLFILELIRGQESVFFDFIRKIKQDAIMKDVPIIVLGHRDILLDCDIDINKI
jgi:DNA-binding response OmpR family regulator